MQMCFNCYFYLFLTISQKVLPGGGNGRSGTAVFRENFVAICTHDRCLDIHGYPRKICGYGYGYGWQISYPRQAW